MKPIAMHNTRGVGVIGTRRVNKIVHTTGAAISRDRKKTPPAPPPAPPTP